MAKVKTTRKKRAAIDAPGAIEIYFLRVHTHGILRRYLYASLQTCRIGSTLNDPIGRGWVSSRPIKSFEDALIFVHDMERCIETLSSRDRKILQHTVIQEHTQAEAARLMGVSLRTLNSHYNAALDRLSKKLVDSELLILP